MFRQIFESILRQHGITMENTIELWSIESIKQCVAGNLGVSFLPRFAIEEELNGRATVQRDAADDPCALRPSRRESNQSGNAGIHAVYAGGTRGALKFGDENDESLNHC